MAGESKIDRKRGRPTISEDQQDRLRGFFNRKTSASMAARLLGITASTAYGYYAIFHAGGTGKAPAYLAPRRFTVTLSGELWRKLRHDANAMKVTPQAAASNLLAKAIKSK